MTAISPLPENDGGRKAGPDFIRRQKEFAAHIRDPEKRAAPADVEDRRMAIYRELFYNNLESFLASNFPVIRRITADEAWHAMVRDFFIRHRCRTPHFPEIAQEFLAYLQDERENRTEDPPYLLELAHYEWVELAVSIDDGDRHAPAIDPNGDLLSGIPVASPVAWNLTYSYPVHRIGEDFQPQQPGEQPTHLVVYRDRRDRVHFLEINPVTQRLLALVKEDAGRTGLDVLKIIATELRHPDPETVIRAGSELLADLRARNIVLGTRGG